MGEIIHLQVGQCGNQVGSVFWERVLQEHSLDADGRYTGTNPDLELSRCRVYFQETERGEGRSGGKGRFLPRALAVDLEPGVVESLRTTTAFGGLLAPERIIHGLNGASNNWARGHYTEGAELIEPILEQVRKLSEECDRLQGFQLCHSLGGGTGSGLGTLLLSKIREDWSDRMLATVSVVPSPKISDTIVEPYNTLLAAHHLIECADECFLLDNEALYDISLRALKDTSLAPTYKHLNTLVARGMCGATDSMRFPGHLNSDLRKLATNLIPFPRLHFFGLGHVPISEKQSKKIPTPKQLTNAIFAPFNFMCAFRPEEGQYLTAATSFRGKHLTMGAVEEQIKDLQSKYSGNFVNWIPSNISISLCSHRPLDSEVSATSIVNSTAMMDLFKRVDVQFDAMYRRKAFLFTYLAEGMEEMELQEAQTNMRDLIDQYQQVGDATLSDFDLEEGAAEDAEISAEDLPGDL